MRLGHQRTRSVLVVAGDAFAVHAAALRLAVELEDLGRCGCRDKQREQYTD